MSLGHVAPAQPGQQQRVLGAQVAQPPGAQRQHAEVLPLGQRGAIGQHQLHLLARHRAGDRRGARWGGRAGRAPGMCRRRHRDQPHLADPLPFQRVRHGPPSSRSRQAGRSRPARAARRRPGPRCAAAGPRSGTRRRSRSARDQACGREHHVDRQAQLRLQPAAQRGGAGAQLVHQPADAAGIGDQARGRPRSAPGGGRRG